MRSTEQHDSVKSLLAGSAVVSSMALRQTWARPLTRADVLPAHAQTKSSDQDSDNNVNTGHGGVSSGYGGYG